VATASSKLQTLPPHLDWATCDRARLARDLAFDGLLPLGRVLDARLLPSVCPMRPARSENVTFYATAAAAERAGFRPCLRCRPETAPGSPAWMGTATTVARGMRMIEEGFLDRESVASLSAALGVGSRHLLRLFMRHAGASPSEVAATRRVQKAK
jgi:AraC family transcriptional regulator, regulatory protein of adaptative response / methylated-DNA-[protein]-cysteine methyltransferase